MINRKKAVVWAATFSALVVAALAVATARAANSPSSLAKVQALIVKLHLKPYKTETNILGPDGISFYTCKSYDTSTVATPTVFSHHLTLCVRQDGLIVPKKKAADKAAS